MLPLAEDEGPVPDERGGVGPLLAAPSDLILTRRHAHPERGDRVEVRSRVGKGKRDVVAADLDVVEERRLRRRELRGIVLLWVHVVPDVAADDDVAGERVVAGRGRVAKPLPSVLEVVGRYGLSVGVLETVTNRVCVGLAVGADLGLILRRRRNRLTTLNVEGHQSLEDLHVHSDLLDERGLLGVDVVGLATHVGHELPVGVGLIGSAAGGWTATLLRAGADDHGQQRHERQERPDATASWDQDCASNLPEIRGGITRFWAIVCILTLQTRFSGPRSSIRTRSKRGLNRTEWAGSQQGFAERHRPVALDRAGRREAPMSRSVPSRCRSRVSRSGRGPAPRAAQGHQTRDRPDRSTARKQVEDRSLPRM